ncbi:MAG: hypothetical protein ABR577_04520 [Pyrinomonadaceae bacterium]
MEKLIEETTVDGKTVRLVHDDVPLERIELDQDNPRIRYRLSVQTTNGKKPSEKELAKLILGVPEVKQLLRDIQRNGGLRERVILQENGDKLKAIEGNCRLTCLRDLHEKNPTDARWKKVPARILPKDVDPKHVAILLSDFHVAGKIKWDAHEKAGQIYHMANELNMTQEEVAVYLHTSKSTVNRYLQAYGFMVDKFLKVDNGKYSKEGQRKWSYFDEFFKKKELREEMTKNPEFGDSFCQWVGDGTLPNAVDVRRLPTILKHSNTRKALEEGTSLDEINKMIEAAEPEEGSDFFKLLAKMRDACTSAAQVKEILRIRTDKVARQRVLETYEAMVDFMRLADVEPPHLKE